MKIAVIRQRFVASGGAERYLQALVHDLQRSGHEVHLFANRWSGQTTAPIHHVPIIRLTSFFRALTFALACKRLIRPADFDLVFSLERTMRQDVYRAGDGCHAGWLQQRTRYVSPAKAATFRLSPLHQLLLALERQTFSAANTRRIIANSWRGKTEIVRLYQFPEDRIQVIYNGVDLKRYHSGARCPPSKLILLFVGSGFERKGLRFCIEALSKLPAQFILQVAGKGNVPDYRRLAASLGVEDRVEFLGHDLDLPGIYRQAHLLVHPAIYEPFANVCLEAMACGLPVVTTSMNGASEILSNTRAGRVIEEPSDIDQLTDAIRSFSAPAVWEDASARARKIAEEHPFTRNVTETLELLELVHADSHELTRHV